MQPPQCFCSNPVVVHSDSEDDYESHIYCSRSCALTDAFRALTARQGTPRPGDIMGSTQPPLTQEQLGYVTHYRRIVRRGGLLPGLSGKFVNSVASSRSSGSPDEACSSPSTYTSPPTSSSSSISSLEYLDTKPLPALPRRETRVLRSKKTRHNLKEEAQAQQAHPTFRRNISNRYPPVNPQPAPAPTHNRNSSLSSFADSSRFTTQTVSTRVTSVASSCNDHAASRHTSRRETRERLHQLAEEDEPSDGADVSFGRSDRSWSSESSLRSADSSGYIDLTSPSARSVWDMSSSYDPFELDQLMMCTPRVYSQTNSCSSSVPGSADVSIDPISPLNVPFRSQLPYQLSPATAQDPSSFEPILAPAIELERKPTVIAPKEPPPESTGLAPPGNRLQPASPSAFPTTPSLSPLVCTPTSSPHQETTEPTPKGPTFKSLTYSPPCISGTTFTLHRRRRPDLGREGALPLGLPGSLHLLAPGLSLNRARDQLPITPLDPQEEVTGYFEKNGPVLGPGTPLFLEPLAGLGFDIDSRTTTRREPPGVTEALQRAATVHNTSAKCAAGGGAGASSPADDVLDYYLGRSSSDVQDDRHPASRRTFNFI
ncbi:hypothetical protein FRB90_003954 [Tulasnella sp. 427]|nr:hypothetical protein FRB90_003954 [Tulasnella sp. 427]